VFRFYTSLQAPRVPAGIQVMNPYAEKRVRNFVRAFLDKYFADNNRRVLVIGINPGRFGAGITGITFTDPVVLDDVCGIPNHLPRRRELSSIFIYQLIDRLGGARAFYERFFLTAMSPLGFTRAGKNLNYYDDRRLLDAVTAFITKSIDRHIAIGGRTDHAIILGRGENFRFMRRLNELHGFFEHIHALDHPRPIMQYRRKQIERYLGLYEEVFARTQDTAESS
jgi:hypothetical protein